MSKQGDGRTRRDVLELGAAVSIGLAAPWVWTSRKAAAQVVIQTIVDPRFTQPVIDPLAIPKFVDPLPVPGATWPIINATSINLEVRQASTQILPLALGLSTPGWAYRGSTAYTSTYLGPTIVGSSGTQTTVVYDYSPLASFTTHILKRGGTTDLTGGPSVVDKEVHGTDMGEPEVRFIAHKHGSVGVTPASDGYAESWITRGGNQNDPGVPGPSVIAESPSTGAHEHEYPNDQGACLAWYHDHALGITRLNVQPAWLGLF